MPPLTAKAPPTERELVERCLRGDDGAWDCLLARYERLLYAICSRMRLSPDDATEVFQEVAVRLVHWLPSIREPERIAGWLAVTTRREAIRYLRRAARDVLFDPRDPEDVPWRHEPVDVQAPADEQLFELERAQILESSLAEMPEPCQSILRAFLGEGESYHQIAARLGVPIGSLGPTRARCLTKLRKLVRQRGLDV
jgi:RNA polymerase sigma factor (sigma-70 family)